MHGGAHGSGAPPGKRNGAYRHGMRTQRMIELQREVRELTRISWEMIAAYRS